MKQLAKHVATTSAIAWFCCGSVLLFFLRVAGEKCSQHDKSNCMDYANGNVSAAIAEMAMQRTAPGLSYRSASAALIRSLSEEGAHFFNLRRQGNASPACAAGWRRQDQL